MLIADWCKRNGLNEPIHYVFSNVSKQAGVLDPIFEKMLSSTDLKSRYRLSGMWTKGLMREVVQLQAADIIAYEGNKRAANHLGPGTKVFRKSLLNLRLTDELKFDPMFFGRDELIDWINDSKDMLETPSPSSRIVA
jgi:hypothetical protein